MPFTSSNQLDFELVCLSFKGNTQKWLIRSAQLCVFYFLSYNLCLSPCLQKCHLMNYSLNREWVGYRDEESKKHGTEPGEKWWQVIFHHHSPDNAVLFPLSPLTHVRFNLAISGRPFRSHNQMKAIIAHFTDSRGSRAEPGKRPEQQIYRARQCDFSMCACVCICVSEWVSVYVCKPLLLMVLFILIEGYCWHARWETFGAIKEKCTLKTHLPFLSVLILMAYSLCAPILYSCISSSDLE